MSAKLHQQRQCILHYSTLLKTAIGMASQCCFKHDDAPGFRKSAAIIDNLLAHQTSQFNVIITKPGET